MADQKHNFGTGPIGAEYQAQMRALAEGLDDVFNGGGPKKTGFVLLVFPFGEGDGHRCNYISNAQRADIVTMLREQLAYFEGAPDNQRGRA